MGLPGQTPRTPVARASRSGAGPSRRALPPPRRPPPPALPRPPPPSSPLAARPGPTSLAARPRPSPARGARQAGERGRGASESRAGGHGGHAGGPRFKRAWGRARAAPVPARAGRRPGRGRGDARRRGAVVHSPAPGAPRPSPRHPPGAAGLYRRPSRRPRSGPGAWGSDSRGAGGRGPRTGRPGSNLSGPATGTRALRRWGRDRRGRATTGGRTTTWTRPAPAASEGQGDEAPRAPPRGPGAVSAQGRAAHGTPLLSGLLSHAPPTRETPPRQGARGSLEGVGLPDPACLLRQSDTSHPGRRPQRKVSGKVYRTRLEDSHTSTCRRSTGTGVFSLPPKELIKPSLRGLFLLRLFLRGAPTSGETGCHGGVEERPLDFTRGVGGSVEPGWCPGPTGGRDPQCSPVNPRRNF